MMGCAAGLQLDDVVRVAVAISKYVNMCVCMVCRVWYLLIVVSDQL